MQALGAMVGCEPVIVTSLYFVCICKLCLVMELMCNVAFPYYRDVIPVPLVMSDLLMETVRWREEWKCSGEQYMTLLDGVSVMLKSHVDSMDTLSNVS